MSFLTSSPVQLIKKTFEEFSRNNCFQMAAALAYYTIFALPALLVVVISVAGFFWDPEDVRGQIQSQMRSVVGASGAEQVHTMIEQANKPGRGVLGVVVGTLVLIFGATGVVVQLQLALNQAWEVKPNPKAGGIKAFVVKRVLSFGMILGIAFLLLVSLVASTVLSAAGEQIERWLSSSVSSWMIMTANMTLSFLVITLLFAAMLKFLPDAEIAWKDVFVGASFTALLFVAGKFLLGLYLGNSDVGSTYGAAGALVLILTWIYYSGLIFFLGAEFTQVWSRRYGERIKPEAGAVRVVQKVVQIDDEEDEPVTASQ